MLGTVSHRWSKLSAHLVGILCHAVTIVGPFLLKEDEMALSPRCTKLQHCFFTSQQLLLMCRVRAAKVTSPVTAVPGGMLLGTGLCRFLQETACS